MSPAVIHIKATLGGKKVQMTVKVLYTAADITLQALLSYTVHLLNFPYF
jgi:hypothetical protein